MASSMTGCNAREKEVISSDCTNGWVRKKERHEKL
jgi:hypothetical protein